MSGATELARPESPPEDAIALDLNHLAGEMWRVSDALDRLEKHIDRHALFLSAPQPDELRRWVALLNSASNKVTDVREQIELVYDECVKAAGELASWRRAALARCESAGHG